MSEVVFGVIGGSGLYDMEGFTAQEEIVLDTPFGSPSDAYIVGELEGAKSIHTSPWTWTSFHTERSELSNVWGLKKLVRPQRVCRRLSKSDISPGTWCASINSLIGRGREKVSSVVASLAMYSLETRSRKSFGTLCLKLKALMHVFTQGDYVSRPHFFNTCRKPPV